MNYIDASSRLNMNAKGIKLPEWTGCWFKRNDQIFVLTRNGEVLDTPDIELYKDRTDWELVIDGLGFDFAILALKNGKCVSRKGWNGKGMFIFMRPEDVLASDFLPKVKSLPQSVKDIYTANPTGETYGIKFTAYLCMKAADGTIVNGWLASQTDLLANDWELYQ